MEVGRPVSPPTHDELLGEWDNLDPTCTNPKNLKVRISECDRESFGKRAKDEARLQSPDLKPESCSLYGKLFESLRVAGVSLASIDTQVVCVQHSSKFRSFYPVVATAAETPPGPTRDH